MRRIRTLLGILGLLLLTAGPAAARSDTVPSFSESPGCGAFNGLRGPQVGPGPYDPSYPYSNLPDTESLRGPWADYYGRTIADVKNDLVVVHLPGLAKDLYIHQRVLPAFNQVLANLAAQAAQGNVYEIRSDTWSFSPATIPPGRNLSFHGVGAAIDVNSTTNPFRSDNVLVTDMPGWFVDAWRDAGWCWGGDWISIKDPMHFAWMGPTHTPGFGPDPAPDPAATPPSGFDTEQAVPNAFQATIPASALFAIDVDRDGAADVVRFQESYKTGAFRLEAAQGWRRFETCTATGWANAPPVQVDTVLMGDYTSDGRPELWLLDVSGTTVSIAVYRIVSTVGGGTTITGTPQSLGVVATSIPVVPGARYAVADHDRDAEADLYVVTPGTSTRVEVWQGPGFTTRLVDATVPISTDSGWRFSMGDHDLDGIPDLYGLSPDAPATLQIVHGGAGFTGTVSTVVTGITPAAGEAFFAEDYDGDGNDDLYLVRSDGRTRVVLGGVRSPGDDLDGWFVKVDLSWSWGSGCIGPSTLRVVTDPPVASQILLDGVPADTWGLTWVKLPPGDYQLSFTDVEGFVTPPAQTITLTEQQTTTITGTFTQRGFLRVTTDPAVPATISIDGVARNDWGMWTDLAPGDHQVCFGDVTDYTAPACQTATVTSGTTTTVTGTYTPSPGAAGPTAYGMLRVTTSPALPSQILVDGVIRDSWGLNWLKLPAGTYQVSFSDVEGFSTPAAQTITITEGQTTEITGTFTQHGFLRVLTNPAVPATISIDGIPRNDWGMWTDLAPGNYQVCFGDVTNYTAPACQTATITPGATTTITGTYT